MSAAFIVDCSITMSWCFADEVTEATAELQDRLVGETVLVPVHWFLEVTNVLAMAEKRGRILPVDADEFLRLLRQLDIEVDNEVTSRAFDHLLPLCRNHGLTSYDAAYLDLAVRRQLPLATLDDELRTAAGSLRVDLLGK